MSIQVETKDCTSISDAELAEMADLCAEREPRFDIGFLSKQREEWVLVTRAREGTKLRGYSFSTLERIGGTPSLLIGLATVDRTSKSIADRHCRRRPWCDRSSSASSSDTSGGMRCATRLPNISSRPATTSTRGGTRPASP